MADLEKAAAIASGLCEQFEGLRLRPYKCPAGVPTIGIGSTHYLDGRAVQMKRPRHQQGGCRADAEARHRTRHAGNPGAR